MNPGKSAVREDVVAVSGMHCASCARLIERNLKDKEGVISVEVNIAEEKLYVTYDEDAVSLDDIKAAIEESGYIVV